MNLCLNSHLNLILRRRTGGENQEGRKGTTGRSHYKGNECLDIHVLEPAGALADIAREYAVEEVALDRGRMNE